MRPGIVRRIVGVVLILLGLLFMLALLLQLATQPRASFDIDPGYAMGQRLGNLFVFAIAALLVFFGVRLQLSRRRKR